MIAVVHPTGNANVRGLLRGLEHSGVGYRFFTTLACTSENAWLKWCPRGVRSELLRRNYGIPSAKIRMQPARELTRLVANRLRVRSLTRHETGWACIDAVYRALDKRVAGELDSPSPNPIGVVHAYEDGALETFKAAQTRGIFCSYELPIAYWETARSLLREEGERRPVWKPTLLGTRDSDEKLLRKTQEVELADLVVCPSGFVHDSLPQRIRELKPCIVAPFGSPPASGPRHRPTSPNRPLRVLFAGLMTQRKGLADLFDAMRLLKRNDVQLVVMGALVQPLEFYRAQYPDFVYEPPRPHAQVLSLMQSCDALVLPSIVEGRALVQQEALSCGLPIVITPNSGGEDLIDEGRTGFLVPIRSPEKIAEAINAMADRRADLPEMAELARQKAASITWATYGDTVLQALLRKTDRGARPVTSHASPLSARN